MTFRTTSLLLLVCLLPLLANSQEGVAPLLKAFDRFRSQNLQEKLYVHTDRTLYLTGETMWLKVYSVDGSLHRPLDLNRVVYIELIDQENRAQLKTKMGLDSGEGAGSLFLPATLPSGCYKLRAYTNWQKNFTADFYFYGDVTLVNPFMKLPPTRPEGTSPVPRIEFFPEGGHLVNGIRSVVAFRVTDRFGRGISSSGFILGGAGDTVARLVTRHEGMGRFEIEPKAGAAYSAQIEIPGGKFSRSSLPSAAQAGVVLRLTDSPLSVDVTVAATQAFEAGPILLLVHTRQVVGFFEQKMVAQGKATFSVPKDKLGDGVTHITLFDRNLLPLCERLYFKAPACLLELDLIPSQPEYATRGKVKVQLSASVNGLPTAANLSLSVYRIDSLPAPDPVHIAQYLLLTSELKGRIDNPQYYFGDSEDARSAADLLMLTKGWSRYRWENVFRNISAPSVVPEHHGHFITAKVTDRLGMPVKGVPGYLSFPSASGRLYSAVSDRNGRLQFEVQNFYGRKKAFLQLQAGADSLYSLSLEDSFSGAFTEAEPLPLSLRPAHEAAIIRRSIAMQVQDVYHDDEINRKIRITEDTSSFFGLPDERYYLDDYTRFPLMEEVFREYVKGVWVRKEAGRYRLKVIDQVNTRVFEEDPLVTVDGVPVYNVNSLMEIDPMKVKRVDVMTRTFFLGPHAIPGLVSISTYGADLGDITIDPASVTIDYEGLQLRQEFYSPVYETAAQRESRLPDRRTLLHWNPSLRPEPGLPTEAEFYTSDLTGNFLIVVEGLTPGGVPGTGIARFSVK